MRSRSITRLYLQVPPDESIDRWPDEAIWREMFERMTTADGWRPSIGRILQKSVTPMRSFVAEPMRYHISFWPATQRTSSRRRGEGLNLAASDVLVLARALSATTSQAKRGGSILIRRCVCDACGRRSDSRGG
jgi:p-hydroxybenzoate 3-monooxygenase